MKRATFSITIFCRKIRSEKYNSLVIHMTSDPRYFTGEFTLRSRIEFNLSFFSKLPGVLVGVLELAGGVVVRIKYHLAQLIRYASTIIVD